MSETGTDERTSAKESNKGLVLSPAVLAERVAMLVGDEASVRSGELPLWDRLNKSPRRPSWRSRLLSVLAWCVTIGLLVVAALRILSHDATVPLVWLNAYTLYIYLPAYLILVSAAWTRRWWLAMASATVVACHLTWVLPDFRPATPYVPPYTATADPSPPIKIFYANVRGGSNLDMDSLLDEALREDPDVIVLVEVQPYWWRQMIEQNPLKAYPFGTDMLHRNAGDIGVFSRLPVRRMDPIRVENRTILSLDILCGTESLQLFALHSPRPMFQVNDDYFKFWQKVDQVVAEQRGPSVVIGDFNATQHSRVYEQLESDGLRSAHEDRGLGYVTTWPNRQQPVPPIRIDQAFLSPEVECLSIEEGAGSGSDHKSLILELRVH
jgi:endonuclease/exonuclease/phosphatase (EEP) superfamily protein YafD